MMDGRLKLQKGDCVSPRNTVPLRARQYIKCLSKRRNDANVRIANRLFPCGGGMSLACHVVDACLSCCVFHVLQITKEKWMICFGEVLRGALRYLDAKIIYHAPPLQVKPKIFRRLGFHCPPGWLHSPWLCLWFHAPFCSAPRVPFVCFTIVCTKMMKKTTKDDEIKKKIVNLQAGRK